MPTLTQLREDMKKRSLDALAVVEDGSLSFADKKSKIDGLEAEIKAFQDQIAEEEFLSERRKKYAPAGDVKALGDGDGADTKALSGDATKAPASGGDEATSTKSLGQQFVESVGYKSLL
ncbi:MAG: hypothetical protein LC792_20815, partial [Actinobacteria bacterium]|nr:hypothetical protein [Actinomycetota bacterium]